MENTFGVTSNKPGMVARLSNNPLVRAVLGVVLTFAPVPLTMILASLLVEKSYRLVWPQMLAALLVWFGYRLYVCRIEKREPSELATTHFGRDLGLGLAIGAGLVMLTFGVLAVLGAYRFGGVNAPDLGMLKPLAELALVGLAEEMLFRGVIFGVAERALGSKPAILISALLFSLAHLPNEGMSLLAVAVIAAYGVMQAALYMRTRRLWVCIGTHIAWNYCVGAVFSSAVSGHAASGGLLRGELAGDVLLTGGAFGIEGSLVALLLIMLVAALCLRRALASRD